MSVLGELSTGIGGVLGGLISGNMTAQAQDSANNTNVYLARYSYDKNLEMWNKQNAYNSPKAQMERYAAAGLNPNLIYGQQNTAGAAPQFDAPTVSPVTGKAQGVTQAFNNAMAVISTMLAARKQKADIDKTNEETRGQQIQNEILTWKNLSDKIFYNRVLDFNNDYYMLTNLKNDLMQQKYQGETKLYPIMQDFKRQQYQSKTDLLPMFQKFLNEKYKQDTAQYGATLSAKIRQLNMAAALAGFNIKRGNVLLPYQQQYQQRLIKGMDLLNDIREIEKQLKQWNYDNREGNWRTMGFKYGGFGISLGDFVDGLEDMNDLFTY